VIRVIATGGTIASLADAGTGVVRPVVGVEELVKAVPGLREGPLEVEELSMVSGWNVTPPLMLELSSRVDAALEREDVEGVVVTHGTDTVEEAVFFCDLTVASDKPVAFAAAMRAGDEVGADGPRNLLAAAALARSGARGLGSVLAINDELHAGRWARKVDSARTSAFASPGHGPVGFASPDVVRLRGAAPPRRVRVPRPAALERPVPVVHAYTGIEEEVIDAMRAATGAAGLVVEGTGLGNVPGSAVAGIERALADGLPVVIASRTLTGGTAPVYGGPGGGATLEELGVLGAGPLSAAKARLLLMLLLAEAGDRNHVRRSFAAAVEELT
jgi:L-asparaginase